MAEASGPPVNTHPPMPAPRTPSPPDDGSKKEPRGSAPSKDSNREGFETRLERLRTIVEELEAGDLPLESAIERYEEGVRVLKSCAETLGAARLRVEELSKDADGLLGLRAAQDLEDAAAPEGGSVDEEE